MKNYTKILYKIVLTILITPCLGFITLNAQQVTRTELRGVIYDSNTGEPIPYAVVIVEGTTDGTSSDAEGNFDLKTKAKKIILRASCLGYQSETISLTEGSNLTLISIKLTPSTKSLPEIVVKSSKRTKYRNKANPAVELIDKVIEHKGVNRLENFDYLQYEKYEKTQFAFSNISSQLKDSKILKPFRVIFDNIDTIKHPGKVILPLYIKESIFDCYYRKDPRASSEIIKADKMIDLEGYLNNDGITGYLKYLYQHIDIYDNNILFLTNIFLSPVAKSAPTFYRYYITDTVNVGESKCTKLYFTPRNKTDMLFQGFLYVVQDSTYAIKKVEMAVNRKINLNWVNDASITQEFDNADKKGWILSYDDLSIDFGITQEGLGVFGQRSVSYRDYSINKAMSDSVFKIETIARAQESVKKTDEYWDKNRHVQLSKSEAGIYSTVDSLKRVPAFIHTMDILRILIGSFHDFGKFEIGPIVTFYSHDPIEGSKFRFGGRTTPKFSKKINFDGYLAYGLKDHQFKYNIGTTYSFTNKSIYEFPVKSLRVNYQYDTKIPGQKLYFVQEGSGLMSLRRGVLDKLFYNKTFKVEYLNEFQNHFSYSVWYSNIAQRPGGTLNFNKQNYLSNINSTPLINISEVGLNLRYAPHEEFYQGKTLRAPVTNKYPVLQLTYTYGSKLIGNDYNYSSLNINLYKRFYPSTIGYTTITLDAGKIFGKVPFPLLEIHNANQSYLYQSTAFNLMNFLEFVSDQYVSVNLDHCFNGFIFNKIPLFNRLGLRENISAKVLYGSLTDRNDPDCQTDLFKLPTDSKGNPTTFTLEGKPYVEVSVGISNIFKILRVDFVQRLTYLNHPNVSGSGIRLRYKFDL